MTMLYWFCGWSLMTILVFCWQIVLVCVDLLVPVPRVLPVQESVICIMFTISSTVFYNMLLFYISSFFLVIIFTTGPNSRFQKYSLFYFFLSWYIASAHCSIYHLSKAWGQTAPRFHAFACLLPLMGEIVCPPHCWWWYSSIQSSLM